MTDPLPCRIAWFAPWTWKRRTLGYVLLVLLAILVAYPLSFSPAVYLLRERRFPHQTFDVIYRPLLWSASRTNFTNRALTWYGNFFISDPPYLAIGKDGTIFFVLYGL